VQRVAFESFRDLVKLARKGLSDEAGLAYVANEALDLRVAARFKANASAGVQSTPAIAAGLKTTPLDFSGAPPSAADGGDAESGDRGDGDDGDDAAEDDMIDAVATGAEALDATAAEFGIAHFSAQLQRAVIQEEEDEAAGDPMAAVRRKCSSFSSR
jgi:hypothetical protein